MKKEQNSHTIKANPKGELITLSKKEYDDLEIENVYLRHELSQLKHELAQMKRMIFGSKSERFVPQDPNQLTLEIEEPAAPILPKKKPKAVNKNINKPEKKACKTSHSRVFAPGGGDHRTRHGFNRSHQNWRGDY